MSNPCKNGGVCSQIGSLNYKCQCSSNCSGFDCSDCVRPITGTSQSTTTTTNIRTIFPTTSTSTTTATINPSLTLWYANDLCKSIYGLSASHCPVNICVFKFSQDIFLISL